MDVQKQLGGQKPTKERWALSKMFGLCQDAPKALDIQRPRDGRAVVEARKGFFQ